MCKNSSQNKLTGKWKQYMLQSKYRFMVASPNTWKACYEGPTLIISDRLFSPPLSAYLVGGRKCFPLIVSQNDGGLNYLSHVPMAL